MPASSSKVRCGPQGIDAPAFLHAPHSVLDNQGSFLNAGTVDALDPAALASALRNDGTFTNSGAVVVRAVEGSGTYTQTAGITRVVGGSERGNWHQSGTEILGGQFAVRGVLYGALHNDGFVGALPGGLALAGPISGSGSFGGTLCFEGAWSPGNSPALVTADDLVLAAGSLLTLEIGGRERGVGHDAIDANTIALGGHAAP